MADFTDIEALAYIASYRDLISAIGADPEAGRRHYAAFGVAEGRRISFDPLSYTASHADLSRAFGTDAAAAARHFIVFGSAEGRTVSFDALRYTATYADLALSFGFDMQSAARHFISFGLREGRSASFDPLNYIASHPDLIAAFGADAASGTRHYIANGAAEGRVTSFDGLNYIASHPDLVAALGPDAAAGARHYIRFGFSEGRGTSFDPVAYLLTHPDLQAAALGSDGALRHWFDFGGREGRSQTGQFGAEQTAHAFTFGGAVVGAFDTPGDRDWFSVRLLAGQQAEFLAEPGGSGTVLVSIHGADGRLVSEGVGVGAAFARLTAAEGGTYYVTAGMDAPGGGAYTLYARSFLNDFLGTNGQDTLNGGAGDDRLHGLAGGDMLDGRAGNDLLEGGSGPDTLQGGMGHDRLYGNNADGIGFDTSGDFLSDTAGGNDQLYGQDGDDGLSISRDFTAPPSTLLLDGGAGNDSITFFSPRTADRATIIAGPGDDRIEMGTIGGASIDAGDGADRLTLSAGSVNLAITLGAGPDVLTLNQISFVNMAPFVGASNWVADFQPGADRLVLDTVLTAYLQGWNPQTNPFAGGFLRVRQAGADALLEIDRNGGGDGFQTLLTLANLNAATLTGADLGYAPDGSASAGALFTGTAGNDALTGAAGNDTLRGLDGADWLSGSSGADLLEGGTGRDTLDGGLGDDTLYGNAAVNGPGDTDDQLQDFQGGNDQLFGQDGDDSLSVVRSGNGSGNVLLLDGGAGNDRIFLSTLNGRDTVTALGAAGDDDLEIGRAATAVIDAGSGADRLVFDAGTLTQTITLGAGADYAAASESFATVVGGPPQTRFTDFNPAEDRLVLDRHLGRALVGWDQISNPFANSYLRLTQAGADTLLEIDVDGGGDLFTPYITFQNTSAPALTELALGYASNGAPPAGLSLNGASAADRIAGTLCADTIRGADGNDTLEGRAGADLLEGGAGGDRLDGGLGNDVLYGNNVANGGFDFGQDLLQDFLGGNDSMFGQDGFDNLSVSRQDGPASTVLMDGGGDSDTIIFSGGNRAVDTVTAIGGDGADRITILAVAAAVIDGGAGDDTVFIGARSGNHTITLGAGSDTLQLDRTFGPYAPAVAIGVTDHQAGVDRLVLDGFLGDVLQGWDPQSNPFTGGFLRLAQTGADARLQIDVNGGGDAFTTLLTFQNFTASTLSSADLGYQPTPVFFG